LRHKANLEVSLVQVISFKRHRFPPDAIRYAVWLYFRICQSNVLGWTIEQKTLVSHSEGEN
jgi:hypothetical protein